MSVQSLRPSSVRLALVNGGLPLGGSTTFLINLAGELVRRDVPVLVTSFERDNPMASDFRRQGIPLHLEDERMQIFEDRMTSTLEALCEFQPTCVVSCLGPSSFELQRYLPSGIQRLGMVQSDYPEIYPQVAPYVPFLDGMVGVSKSIQRNLASHPALGRLPSYYLPYGVEIPLQLERPLRPTDKPLRILYLGRLCRPQKRVHLFPELLRVLIAADIPFVWTIAGDGPEKGALEQLLTVSAPHQHVRFMGPVSYDAVPGLLAENDIFLLISDAEGLPLSLLEAMGRGTVPVISDLPSGVPEVVSESTGRKVPIADISGYARAIVELHHRREELQRLANNGARQVRQEFLVGRAADRWLEVLQRAPESAPEWPAHWNIMPPLVTRHPVLFLSPLRLIRRWLRIGYRLWSRNNRPA